MKALFFFVIGAIAGAYAFSYFQDKDTAHATAPHTTETAVPAETASPSLSQKAAASAHSAKEAVAEKLAQWHLTPEEVRADLDHTGQVVRTKAREIGTNLSAKTSNARIVTVIKAKYTLDNELSARAIEVDCDAGVVTLKGAVANPALIAKAVGLALDTEGVSKVTSLLTVSSEKE
jgi:osmotically-inducible protein OsmY